MGYPSRNRQVDRFDEKRIELNWLIDGREQR